MCASLILCCSHASRQVNSPPRHAHNTTAAAGEDWYVRSAQAPEHVCTVLNLDVWHASASGLLARCSGRRFSAHRTVLSSSDGRHAGTTGRYPAALAPTIPLARWRSPSFSLEYYPTLLRSLPSSSAYINGWRESTTAKNRGLSKK